jgi:hypothetical protein
MTIGRGIEMLAKKTAQLHFVRQKCHMLNIEPVPPHWEAGD